MPDFATPDPTPFGCEYLTVDGLEGEEPDGLYIQVGEQGHDTLLVRFRAIPFDFRWFGETLVEVA